MIGIDAYVLVRYIAQDDAGQSSRATRLIERECSAATPGFVGLVVLVEVVWVSESCYAATREEIAEIVRRLLSIKQLVVQDAETAWKALRSFESGTADFADCLIERTANVAGCGFRARRSGASVKLPHDNPALRPLPALAAPSADRGHRQSHAGFLFRRRYR